MLGLGLLLLLLLRPVSPVVPIKAQRRQLLLVQVGVHKRLPLVGVDGHLLQLGHALRECHRHRRVHAQPPHLLRLRHLHDPHEDGPLLPLRLQGPIDARVPHPLHVLLHVELHIRRPDPPNRAVRSRHSCLHRVRHGFNTTRLAWSAARLRATSDSLSANRDAVTNLLLHP